MNFSGGNPPKVNTLGGAHPALSTCIDTYLPHYKEYYVMIALFSGSLANIDIRTNRGQGVLCK